MLLFVRKLKNMDKILNKKNNQTAPVAREIDLVRLWNAIWKRAWLIFVCAALCAALFLAVTVLFIAPKYSASAKFYVNNSAVSIGETSLNLSSGDLSASKSLVDTYIVILKSRTCLNDVIDYADLDYNAAQLSSMISASAIGDTAVFEVVVTGTNPEETEVIANAIAHILPNKISNIVEGTSAKIVDYAITPNAPTSPNKTTNFILGFLMGAALSVGVIVLIELFDNTIRSEDDIAENCNYPILAAVPDMSNSSHKGRYYSKTATASRNGGVVVGDAINFAAMEAYKLLRTKIQFSFADDKTCHIIGVSSALLGEGKSLTSCNLAFSLAQLGKKVILVDCDMRRPSIANKLKAKKVPGLSNYLADKTPISEIIQSTGKKFSDFEFDVIAAGHNPPNPVELLDSPKMRDMLEELREKYDYMILDLPPIEEVSDALVAAKLVDGIVLIVSQNYCNRTSFINSVNQFDFVDARILGIVVNRVMDKTHNYGYRKSYYKSRGYKNMSPKTNTTGIGGNDTSAKP